MKGVSHDDRKQSATDTNVVRWFATGDIKTRTVGKCWAWSLQEWKSRSQHCKPSPLHPWRWQRREDCSYRSLHCCILRLPPCVSAQNAPCAIFGAAEMQLQAEVFSADLVQGNRRFAKRGSCSASCSTSTPFSRFCTLLRESASIAFDRSSAEPPPCQMQFCGRKPEPTFTKGR